MNSTTNTTSFNPSFTTAFITDELCFWHDPGNYALMLKPGGFVEPYNHLQLPKQSNSVPFNDQGMLQIGDPAQYGHCGRQNCELRSLRIIPDTLHPGVPTHR